MRWRIQQVDESNVSLAHLRYRIGTMSTRGNSTRRRNTHWTFGSISVSLVRSGWCDEPDRSPKGARVMVRVCVVNVCLKQEIL